MLSPIDQNQQQELKEYLESRAQEISPEILQAASAIIQEVRKNQDQALQEYTKKFDGVDLEKIAVSPEELEAAMTKADPEFKEAMAAAKENIIAFHEAQKQQGYQLDQQDEVYAGVRVLPLEAVGIYVPGGRAQYPSSVLMNALPAHVAGVKRIVMVTPPNKEGTIHPNIAYAAHLAGVTEIYKVGGAQAVAALAYGTETIPPVDKIVGPGNIFVAAAKKLVFGKVDIDMIAGPSEILVIADENASPAYVAADLLSQAEHDPMASAILITPSQKLIDEVNVQLKLQSDLLPKAAIVRESLASYGKSILVNSLEDGCAIANAIAPEHLELQVADPEALLPLIKNAGSVFMGYYTCESIGDYYGGVNHVLPTSGTARFSSPLSVDSFIKKSSYIRYSRPALEKAAAKIIKMAEEEQLQAHANAVKVRVDA